MSATRPRATPLSAGVAVAALLACAWFAVGARQAHDTTVAQSILAARGPLPRADAARVATLTNGAQFLDPGTDADLLRAQLQTRLGHRAAARRIVGDVVRREPLNLEAWLSLAKASSDSPASFLTALEHINRLAPPVPERP